MIVLLAVLFLYGAIGMEWRRAMVFSVVTGALLFAMAIPLFLTSETRAVGSYGLLNLSVALIGCELLAIGSLCTGAALRKIIQLATGVSRYS
jgi:hypothetical protein